MKPLHLWLFLVVSSATANADTARKGREIFEQAEKKNDGFVDSIADATMILKTRNGKKSTRKFLQSTLEGPDGEDKNKLVFQEPKYIKDTTLLTHSKSGKDDEQWLFLPATKRVKRISSSNQSGSFVGSEFSFEDLRAPILDKYNYEFLRDETYAKQDCHVVARRPKSKESGYTKQIIWIDKKHLRVFKTEYYDRKQSLLKTLVAKRYKKYLARYWRPHFQEMTNHQTGKSTVLRVSKYLFSQKLAARDFTKFALK